MAESTGQQIPLPPEVKYGLCSAEVYAEIEAAIAAKDIGRLAAVAVPACEGNELLFSSIFLGRDRNPSVWAKNAELQRYNKTLVRMPRFAGKTTLFTIDTMVHDLAYSVFPWSKYADGRTIACFETRKRADERVEPVIQAFESGGPGGLLGAVFRGQPKTRYEGMTIPEMASGSGCSWNSDHITLPHPLGKMKADPNIKSLTPKEAGVGYHASRLILDDLISPRTAYSSVERERILNWYKYGLRPTIKPYTKVSVPHTVFHPDDLNEYLRKTGEYYLLQINALQRKPSNSDFEEIVDENGVVDVRPTQQGRELKSYWPCPDGDDWKCPMTKEHLLQVGEHRPVHQLLLDYRTDPIAFYQQWMHIMVNTEGSSIKRWMLRFYVTSPDDHRIGKPAPYHEKWGEWRQAHPDIGLSTSPPTVVGLMPDGSVIEEKGGVPVTKVEACAHGWDFAIGKESRHDRTACARLYRTADKRFFAAFRAGRWGHDTVWKMIVTHAISDPIMKPRELVVETNNLQQIYASEVKKLMGQMGVQDKFILTEVKRTKEKDKVFAGSGLPVTMVNGFFYVNLDDQESIEELLSVMPDQTGGHDDILDATINAYGAVRVSRKIKPGPMGGSW